VAGVELRLVLPPRLRCLTPFGALRATAVFWGTLHRKWGQFDLLLNISELGRDAGLNAVTAARYLSVTEDFVIESGKSLMAIEVKAASRWEERDLKGLRAFMEHHPRCKHGLLAYSGEKMAEIAPSIWAVPIGMLLS